MSKNIERDLRREGSRNKGEEVGLVTIVVYDEGEFIERGGKSSKV